MPLFKPLTEGLSQNSQDTLSCIFLDLQRPPFAYAQVDVHERVGLVAARDPILAVPITPGS